MTLILTKVGEGLLGGGGKTPQWGSNVGADENQPLPEYMLKRPRHCCPSIYH